MGYTFLNDLLNNSEISALKKVYYAMCEADDAKKCNRVTSTEWLFWKRFNDLKVEIWNAIGCPEE